ncbi:GNAT family N-acetyltransferase [Boudabousia marimammalium]|uniref:N-acetyltransferase n=1 Tax=Boudabousia marimammalium TaxID=156892 RepID=A0A1Q5PS93_9ACTO|nr:GNAT family N-acetyltransferase [Boudabousia marimammalium]OKL50315.1 N-acetyltransferase [Boudabousia marimammalium]
MLHLEEINESNIWEILKLTVHDDQSRFVATNAVSLAEAYSLRNSDAKVFPFGVYAGDLPVGFIMISYGRAASWDSGLTIARNNYGILRVLIGKEHQHLGYGKKAVELAIEFIKSSPFGDAEVCWISYGAENTAARRLYSSFGFVEDDEMVGDEILATLKL